MCAHAKAYVLALFALMGLLAGCGATASVVERPATATLAPAPTPTRPATPISPPSVQQPSAASVPPGIWCPVVGDGLPEHQAFTQTCEIYASVSAAGGEGLISINEKLGGPPVAETCLASPCVWGADRVSAAQMASPWAIVAMCTPFSPGSTTHITLYVTLVSGQRTFYSWGTVQCEDTSPTTYYEFRRAAPGLAAIQVVGPNLGSVDNWDVVLVQR